MLYIVQRQRSGDGEWREARRIMRVVLGILMAAGVVAAGAVYAPPSQGVVFSTGLIGTQQVQANQAWLYSQNDTINDTISALYQVNAELTNSLAVANATIASLTQQVNTLLGEMQKLRKRKQLDTQLDTKTPSKPITIEGAEHQERFRNLVFS